MPELDDLFSLPSAASIPSAILRFSALYVLLLAIIIQAFSLISVFAPNALSIMPAQPTSSVLSVPYLALDKIAIVDSSMTLGAIGREAPLTYVSPSTRFKSLVQYVLSKGIILPWSRPLGCGIACGYNMTYNGPAMRCRDIAASSIAVYSGDTYQGTAESINSPRCATKLAPHS